MPTRNIPNVVNTLLLRDKMLSSYAKDIAKKHGFTSGRASKLVASLTDKKRYVIHEMNLKQAVDS